MKIYYFIILLLCSSGAFAQSIGFGAGGGDITVSAAESIEWDRANQTIKINKEATMIQGDVKLVADIIDISYQEKNKKQEISFLNAKDNVVISTPTETLTGDEAIYEPNKSIAVLTGKNPTLTMNDGVMTADVFEFFPAENKAVARNNMILKSQKGTVKAKIAVAYMNTKAKGLSRLELFDNVVVNTGSEVINGNKAVYNIVNGLITIEGNVVIQKGKNHLKGDIGEVNLKTGISKLRSTSRKKVGGSVKSQK